jgi:hypothetical protein
VAGRLPINEAEPSAKRLKCRFEVIVQDPSKKTQETDPLDTVFYSCEFRATTEPISCLSIGVQDAVGSPRSRVTQWEVYDNQGNQIKTIGVPTRSPRYPMSTGQIILYFDPSLKPSDVTYSLVFRDHVPNLMGDLFSKEEIQLLGGAL